MCKLSAFGLHHLGRNFTFLEVRLVQELDKQTLIFKVSECRLLTDFPTFAA